MVSKKPINVSFRLDGDDCFLICNRPAVSDVIVGMARRRSPATMQCLVTGEWEEPQRLHGAIKRITDGESSGNPLVSFNLNSFESYGLDQGRNASIGRLAEHKYWTALSALLMRNSHQRIQVGDATTVFWSEKAHPMENLFGDLFDPPKENPSAGVEAVKALFAAPETGAPPLAGDRTRFHILGLAPNASRLAIRFWHMGTIGEVAGRIRRHFDDLDLIHGEKESGFLPLWRLLAATALQGKANNVPPNLAGDVMKAILNGTPYPRTLLAAAVRRTRAERDVTYPRTVLIKAVLVRANRSNPKEVGMALDRENINIGYRLGRLFAVLEKAQLDGHGWRYGDDHKTIMDSYYGAASATPNAVFGRLLRLSKHHLAEIRLLRRDIKRIEKAFHPATAFSRYAATERRAPAERGRQ